MCCTFSCGVGLRFQQWFYIHSPLYTCNVFLHCKFGVKHSIHVTDAGLIVYTFIYSTDVRVIVTKWMDGKYLHVVLITTIYLQCTELNKRKCYYYCESILFTVSCFGSAYKFLIPDIKLRIGILKFQKTWFSRKLKQISKTCVNWRSQIRWLTLIEIKWLEILQKSFKHFVHISSQVCLVRVYRIHKENGYTLFTFCYSVRQKSLIRACKYNIRVVWIQNRKS